MKLTFDKNIFDAAVTPALGCVASRNTLASIEGILMIAETGGNSCEISSYDLEKGYRASFEATIEEGGSYVINAQKLSQIVRSMSGDRPITLEVDQKNLVRISSGKTVFEMVALSGSSFPSMPELSGDRAFTIARGAWKSLIDAVAYAISSSDARPSLMGAYFRISGNSILAVSCDGNRLAKRDVRTELTDVIAGNDVADDGTVTVNTSGIMNASFIIPGKTLGELVRLTGGGDDEPMRILLTSKHVVFDVGGGAKLFSRLIDSDYIDYERFIPKEGRIFVTVDRQRMLSALEMAALFSEDRTMGQPRSGVLCSFGDDMLRIRSAASSGRFDDEIAVEMQGDPIEMSFNCRFLLDALRSCECERLRLTMINPMMSMVIENADEKPEDDVHFLMLVLPMKPMR